MKEFVKPSRSNRTRDTLEAGIAETSSDAITGSPSHNAIAARAFTIYLDSGSQAGQGVEHWLQAESELCTKQRQDDCGASVATSRDQASASSSVGRTKAQRGAAPEPNLRAKAIAGHSAS